MARKAEAPGKGRTEVLSNVISVLEEVKMKPHPESEVERVTLPIYGLTCRRHGVLAIEQAILRVEGVRYAYVNPETEMAYVEYDPAGCTPDRLIKAVEQNGFHAGIPTPR
jgi:copper chaperone CopZ